MRCKVLAVIICLSNILCYAENNSTINYRADSITYYLIGAAGLIGTGMFYNNYSNAKDYQHENENIANEYLFLHLITNQQSYYEQYSDYHDKSEDYRHDKDLFFYLTLGSISISVGSFIRGIVSSQRSWEINHAKNNSLKLYYAFTPQCGILGIRKTF